MKIKSITKVKPRRVYAIETSTHTFVADGLAHHNCVRCNLYKNGAYIEYSQWFIKKYGEETFNRYVDTYRKWQQGKLPALKINELRELHDFWLAKGRELEQKIGPTFPKSWEPLNDPYILTSGGLPDNS